MKSIRYLLLLVLGLHFFWAWQWPILNDESYYWDWSRYLQLSYVDAPPAIAWVSFFGSHLFSGNFAARFLVPLLYLCSTIFLIKSSDILFRDSALSSRGLTAGSRNVIYLFFCIPIFNLYGILLQPDAPLFFALTGTLYFALKSCERVIIEKNSSLSLFNGLGLGLFIGLGVVSKYQASPVAFGIFLAIVCIRGLKQTFQKDLLFWIITVCTALIVSSPLFIWNIQNNYASFRFQGQHGFSTWNFNFRNFTVYIVGVTFVILPWYFYLFCKQIKTSFQKPHFFKSLDVIPLFAFLSIFIFIGISALGKMAKVHWITPSFLFLIPLVAQNWESLTIKHRKFWNRVHIVSGVLSIFVFSIGLTNIVQNFLGKNNTPFSAITKKLQNGLFAGMIWSGLSNPEETIQKQIPQFKKAEIPYFSNLEEIKCTKEPYIASFHWRWSSQLAFYLKNQPRVFVIDLNRATYYTWRDPLEFITECRMYIVGEERKFRPRELAEVMNIQSVKSFTIKKRYSNGELRMVLVEGTMKDAKKLKRVSSHLLQTVPY